MNDVSSGKVSRSQLNEVSTEQEIAVRRSLNALEMSSNLISALIRNPGPLGPQESIVDAAKTMLKSSDAATQDLISRLGLGDSPSAHYSVMRAVSQAVSDRWRSTSHQPSPSADVSDLLPVWVEMAKMEIPFKPATYQGMDDHVSLKIALLDAMLPIIREISVSDLFHDPKLAALHARSQIMGASEVVLRGLITGNVSVESKQLLKAALLKNAGSIYASAWRRQADEVGMEFKRMSEEERFAAFEKHQKGYPLAKVDASFVSSFKRLTELVQFLTPQSKRGVSVSGS